MTSQDFLLSSNGPFRTASTQRLAPPVYEPVEPLLPLLPLPPFPRPTTPVIAPITPAQKIFNLTVTTQATTVASTRTCASTTIEMLFNSPAFGFLRSYDLTGVTNSFLIECVKALEKRKNAPTSQMMTSLLSRMENQFNQMRHMSHSQAIHQLCGDTNKFKIYITNTVRCTASGCWKVVEEIEEPTGTGLTIGPGATVVGSAADFNVIQELLDHHISQSQGEYVCSICKKPGTESIISDIDVPDTFLLHIDMRKVRYPSSLEVRLPQSTRKYQLECGLTTKHNQTSDEYSAFWKASINLYWHMGLDDQFSDIQLAGSYAIKRTSEELPPYPTILVYTAVKYIGTPFPIYRAPKASTPPKSPIQTTNPRKTRKVSDTRKVIKAVVVEKTKRNRKPAGGLLIQKPPIRRSNRLQGKPAKESKKEEE